MNKVIKFFPIVLFICAVLVLSAGKLFFHQTTGPSSLQKAKAKIGLTIFFPENIATFSGISAYTALDALQKKESIETKIYDFGTLVTKVGKIENTSSHAWLYWVNEKEATISSDMYNLTDGDMVEWKYFPLIQ